MDFRGNIPNTYSFCQQNHQILSFFLRSLEHLDPWWVSIISPVSGDHSTTITSILGYEHKVGLEFRVGAGLLKRVNQDKPSYLVIQAEWDKFSIEQKLQDIMETVNWSSIMHSKDYFISYGKKNKLKHHPINQFDQNIQVSQSSHLSLSSSRNFIIKFQKLCLHHIMHHIFL
jgi:hypothetical protein